MLLFLSWAGVLLFIGVIHAADQLTLEQALALAERNPQLRDAAAAVDGANAGIVTARAYPNPAVDLMLGNLQARQRDVLPGLDQYYIFSQPLELPSLRQSRLEAAEHGRDSSELALAETRLTVRTAVRHAFYESLRWEGAITLARETLRLIEDLRRRIQVRVDVGEAGRLELIRADAEVATARTFANTAQLQFVTAISALRAAIGGSVGADIDPEGTLESLPELPPLAAIRQHVLNHYPALLQAQAEVRRAEAVRRTEIALRTPQPAVRFEWERLPESTLYRFGVAFPIPLWNRREGPIGEAEAALQRARAFLDRRTIEVTAALENAYRRYEVASQQVAAFETGVLQQAEEAVRAAEAAYQLGERGIMDVLDSQRVLRSVRLDFVNAQFNQQSALTDLRHLRALDLHATPRS
jgi:cobalt-zinc-cadmium efflux system outer membrane protein